MKDKIIELKKFSSKAKYPKKLRRAAVWDDKNKQVIELITNQKNWMENTISELYKSRWEIEMFFREIKQPLHIKSFIGTTENAVKAPRSWQSQTLMVFPSPYGPHEARTHEVKLVEETIEARFIKEKPQKIVGDLAYDSDPLDKKLKKRKIELITPHKCNRRKKVTQDGRKLRRYCRRWIIKRLFSLDSTVQRMCT